MEHHVAREIFGAINLSDSDAGIVSRKLTKLSVKKGAIILDAGQSVAHQYYVGSGCLRTYYLDGSGKEHTIQFAIKDWWISDYTAFFTQGISMLTIECLQDAEIYELSKKSMEELYVMVPSVETFFRIKMERFFASFQKRIVSDLSMSAKEKYNRFLKTYPEIEMSIRNYHLASYLGITTESLSRIRKEISKSD